MDFLGDTYEMDVSRREIIQMDIIDKATTAILEVLDNIAVGPGQTFVLGDYGSSDGGTSSTLLRKCIVRLKEKYGDELPIQIVYEDQPTNDFNVIFKRVNGLIPSHKGLVTEFNSVFVLASGTGFFSQCMPNNSVDLIFSFNAIHWLNKSIDNSAVMATGLTGHKDEQQAATDWETFLTLRAKELRPGGYLVTALPIVDVDKTRSLNRTTVLMTNIISKLKDVWKELETDSVITQEEFRRMHLDIYVRSLDECREPFQDALSPVRKGRLSLISMVTKVISYPFRNRFIEQKSKALCSRTEHAEKFVDSVRTWTEEGFIRALCQRSVAEQWHILNQFYHRYIERVINNNPENYGADLQYAYIIVQKDRSTI